MIKKYVESRGITLVLRTSRGPDSVSAANPQDVIKEMSQQVLYSQPQMDITDAILEMLSRSNGAASKPPLTPKQTTPPKGSPPPPQNATQKPSNKAGDIKR